jgi:hypothetical protein
MEVPTATKAQQAHDSASEAKRLEFTQQASALADKHVNRGQSMRQWVYHLRPQQPSTVELRKESRQ